MGKNRISEPVIEGLKKVIYPVPRHLADNHTPIAPAGLDTIRSSIKKHYHTGWRSEAQYSKDKYEADLKSHLDGRLESDRRIVIPWLDQARSLHGTRILEVGCGTGSSTVALAEQRARVIGIDIDQDALAVARDRCKAYGVEAAFHALNGERMCQFSGEGPFDFIIFFACLEHMTVGERLVALREAWALLPSGGMLVVVETPNRLWYYDGHTSMLPFFHWLPDDLAFQYSALSPRENFRELYRNYDAASREHFLRRGRGMSFHEFDLAIKPGKKLKIVSSLSTFQGVRHKLRTSMLERKYKALLRRIYPEIHEGFCDQTLYLIIQKD
jgi:S-adenosylmethionine-dependent methyltransferase